MINKLLYSNQTLFSREHNNTHQHCQIGTKKADDDDDDGEDWLF